MECSNWSRSFNISGNGYIFNDKNEMLIVKNKDTWTIPGGHPELYEYTIGTLIRETMEEACISIKDINYMGAVEVIENGEKYYQLRYFARIDKIYEFKQEWEICERKFVRLENLKKYIKWSDGITFKSQIESLKKIIGKQRLNIMKVVGMMFFK